MAVEHVVFQDKYIVKHIWHNPLPFNTFNKPQQLLISPDAVGAEVGVEVGTVDVEFAADLGVGVDALSTVSSAMSQARIRAASARLRILSPLCSEIGFRFR